MKTPSKRNPLRYTPKIKKRLGRLIKNLRNDVEYVVEPKAQALFETAAEVLLGWRRPLSTTRKRPKRPGGRAAGPPRTDRSGIAPAGEFFRSSPNPSSFAFAQDDGG